MDIFSEAFFVVDFTVEDISVGVSVDVLKGVDLSGVDLSVDDISVDGFSDLTDDGFSVDTFSVVGLSVEDTSERCSIVEDWSGRPLEVFSSVGNPEVAVGFWLESVSTSEL